MKQWMKKLIDQFEVEGKPSNTSTTEINTEISEDRATLLFMVDILNKNLFEIEHQSIRKTRETLDQFAQSLLNIDPITSEKSLFRFRQWFQTYRIDEYSYILKTFDDFKNIVWDFADQLSDEIHAESNMDREITSHLEKLREAVESNSIVELKNQSREFIDTFIESQTRKDQRRSRRMDSMQNNLRTIKKQLTEANHNMRTDHLTGAYNRKSFDEQIQKHHQMLHLLDNQCTLIILDIDHFKKVNDQYGHDIGDIVIKECVRSLKEIFNFENHFVARIGGEEFAVILPDFQYKQAEIKAKEALEHIEKQTLVQLDWKIKFTVSMGVAQLYKDETVESWIKRADSALYESKNNGRNRYTIAAEYKKLSVA